MKKSKLPIKKQSSERTKQDMMDILWEGLQSPDVRFRDKIKALEFYCKYLKKEDPPDIEKFNGWVIQDVCDDVKEEPK